MVSSKKLPTVGHRKDKRKVKRYFDIHDKRIVAKLKIQDGSNAATAPVEEFKRYFGSVDVREITLSQYRRLSVQYNK